MKLIIQKENLEDNIDHFLSRNGYLYIFDRHRNVGSFSQPLTKNHYPRLHLYVDGNERNVILNLHLDQKQVSYKGSHMHSAEYDGEVVMAEMLRLKKLLGGEIQDSFSKKNKTKKKEAQSHLEQKQAKVGLVDTGEDAEGRLGKGSLSLEDNNDIEEKKEWWKFW